eukprot:15473989-Alexandrium_andersonii.AAC.1
MFAQIPNPRTKRAGGRAGGASRGGPGGAVAPLGCYAVSDVRRFGAADKAVWQSALRRTATSLQALEPGAARVQERP